MSARWPHGHPQHSPPVGSGHVRCRQRAYRPFGVRAAGALSRATVVGAEVQAVPADRLVPVAPLLRVGEREVARGRGQREIEAIRRVKHLVVERDEALLWQGGGVGVQEDGVGLAIVLAVRLWEVDDVVVLGAVEFVQPEVGFGPVAEAVLRKRDADNTVAMAVSAGGIDAA